MNHLPMTRRGLLGAAAASALMMSTAAAAPRPQAAPQPQGAPKLPARANVIIRNAYVMTMDKDVGDLKDADLHVRDGAIVAIGQKLKHRAQPRSTGAA